MSKLADYLEEELKQDFLSVEDENRPECVKFDLFAPVTLTLTLTLNLTDDVDKRART